MLSCKEGNLSSSPLSTINAEDEMGLVIVVPDADENPGEDHNFKQRRSPDLMFCETTTAFMDTVDLTAHCMSTS